MVNNQTHPLLKNVEAIIDSISKLDFPGLPDEQKAELKKLMEANGSLKQFEEIKKQLAEMKNKK